MRKRTIEARVERLWQRAPFPRRYMPYGKSYAFSRHNVYLFSRGRKFERELRLHASLDGPGAKGALAWFKIHGYIVFDAHEYAHGLDVGVHRGSLSASHLFHQASLRDGDKPTRAGYATVDSKWSRLELFADAVALTIVNDRTFIREHPAKYAYARTLLKENKVI